MRNRVVSALCLVALVALSACGNSQSSSGATSAPAAPQSTPPSSQAPQTPAGIASPVSVPSPSASATPPANLLSYAHGAFVRSWTVAASNRGAPLLASGGGWTIYPDFKQAPQVLFELPAVARIDAINIMTYGLTDPDTHVDVDASIDGPPLAVLDRSPFPQPVTSGLALSPVRSRHDGCGSLFFASLVRHSSSDRFRPQAA